MSRRLLTLAILLFGISFCQYHCDWNVFSAGGTTLSSSDYRTNVSVAQTTIGHLATTNLQAFIGFWQIEPQVGIEEPEAMPKMNQLITKLYNPCPNPFTHNTKILFSLKNNAFTKLLIYDLTGRVVKTLVNGNMQPGIYTINWQGEDEKGKRLACGIYFLKFQSASGGDEYQTIKKVILTR